MMLVASFDLTMSYMHMACFKDHVEQPSYSCLGGNSMLVIEGGSVEHIEIWVF